jgi:hypothetical protein
LGRFTVVPLLLFFVVSFALFARCCGGLFATTSTARWKRSHAPDSSSSFSICFFGVFGMSEYESDKAILGHYCSIMDEIKFRIEWIKNVIHAKIMIAETIGRDIGFLELRMICELIAFGCLVAHGDIKETRPGKFMTKYQADFFVKAMASLHADFYPKPMLRVPGQEPIPTTVGQIVLPPPPRTSGFLTQSDLTALYHDCGERLHRGYLPDILNRKRIEGEFSMIGKTVDKIIRLLDYHRIQLISGEEVWCAMAGGPGGEAFAGKVTGPFRA